MEPFESRLYPLRVANAIVLSILKISIGIVGVSVTSLSKHSATFVQKLAGFSPSIRRKYGKSAFVVALVAVVFAEIAWVSLGGRRHMSSFWGNTPFILLYWAVVAAISAPVGIALGFLEVAKSKR